MLYNIKNAIAYVAEKQYLCTRNTNHLITDFMKKELTKNDSMSIKQHKIEVAAAAFKALLARRGLYQSYFRAWNCDNWRKIDTPVEVAWEDWSRRNNIEDWVGNAFIWNSTSIPSSVWRALSIDWVEYCDGYLNF